MKKEKKDFFKITFEDMQLAKQFFENEKHYVQWLFAVSEYYQGNLVPIKTKIVQKYFNNYKKTMDFIINSKQVGEKGGLKRIENQLNNNQTLEGLVEGMVELPLKYPSNQIINNKIENINNKEEIINNINNKRLIKKEELINKIENFIKEEGINREIIYGYMEEYLEFAERYYSDQELKQIYEDLHKIKNL